MASTKGELTIRFDQERFAFGEGEQRVVIARAWDVESKRSITIKAKAFEGELKRDLTYRLYGRWVNHAKYGWQYHVTSLVTVKPLGRRGVVAYLQQAPGIGPTIADALHASFGQDAVKRLREEPRIAAGLISQLSERRAREAAEFLERHAELEEVTIELTDLFARRGFPHSIPRQCIDRWGNRAPVVIHDNPYTLMGFRGVGFLKADRLWLDLGKDPAAIARQACCIWHAANSASGNTWIAANAALSALRANISSAQIKVVDAFETAKEMSLIVTHTDTDGRRWLSTVPRATQEQHLASAIATLREHKPDWPDTFAFSELSEHQQAELGRACAGSVGCLTGTPGTGKTFALSAAIRGISDTHGPGSVAVCCPTGKAARRATDVLYAAGIRLDATTIHRLLGVQPHLGDNGNGGWSFTYRPGNPLPQRFVIVDEASMCDTFITSALLAACGQDTHVLFVGDTNQLPPVGHGSPLRDFIRAGLPHGHLTEIWRNSGQIVRTCKAIQDTRAVPVSDVLNIDTGENLYVATATTPARQIATLEGVVDRLIAAARYDPVWDVQVLCAINQKSELSRKTLNTMLQGKLNPSGQHVDGNPFRVGDKVINLKNSRLPALNSNDVQTDKHGRVYVANGEQGVVTAVEPRLTYVRLESPRREIKIPMGRPEETEDGGDDDDAGLGCNWDLGYTISSHRSQGSSWPLVAVMLDESAAASRVCDRAWLYTAISRAEQGCLLIGKRTTAESYCRRSNLHYRKTFLAEWIGAEQPTRLPTAQAEDAVVSQHA